VLAAWLGAGVAEAQPRQFSIAPQPLPAALAEFSRASGVQVSAPSGLTAGRTSPGVSGTLEPSAALDRLLAGTTLVGRIDGGTVLLAQAPTTEGTVMLPPVDVTATRAVPGGTIGTLPPPFAGGQVASGGQVGMLGNRRNLETPFATQSYTADLIRERQVQSLTDLTRLDPATSTGSSRYRYFDTLNVRGFGTNYTIDGLPVARGIIQQTEPFERFEVLRGPAATALGNVSGFSPGAINLVPKRAGEVPLGEFTARYLGGSAYGGHADIGRRFGAGNRFGARFNGVFDSGETNIEGLNLDRKAAHLALDYRGDRLRITFDLNLVDNATFGGQPGFTVAAGVAVPKAPRLDRTLGQTWTDYRRQTGFGLLRAEYDVLPDWTVGFASSVG
jgi:iron complex outermembrane receptor protein